MVQMFRGLELRALGFAVLWTFAISGSRESLFAGGAGVQAVVVGRPGLQDCRTRCFGGAAHHRPFYKPPVTLNLRVTTKTLDFAI